MIFLKKKKAVRAAVGATRKLCSTGFCLLAYGLPACQAPWPFLLALVAPALLTAMPQAESTGKSAVTTTAVQFFIAHARFCGSLLLAGCFAPVSPRVVLA
jgi:hypothetical protein